MGVGGAELYNFDREQLAERLNTARSGGHPAGTRREFYHIRPAPGWRFIVLDG